MKKLILLAAVAALTGCSKQGCYQIDTTKSVRCEVPYNATNDTRQKLSELESANFKQTSYVACDLSFEEAQQTAKNMTTTQSVTLDGFTCTAKTETVARHK